MGVFARRLLLAKVTKRESSSLLYIQSSRGCLVLLVFPLPRGGKFVVSLEAFSDLKFLGISPPSSLLLHWTFSCAPPIWLFFGSTWSKMCKPFVIQLIWERDIVTVPKSKLFEHDIWTLAMTYYLRKMPFSNHKHNNKCEFSHWKLWSTLPIPIDNGSFCFLLCTYSNWFPSIVLRPPVKVC